MLKDLRKTGSGNVIYMSKVISQVGIYDKHIFSLRLSTKLSTEYSVLSYDCNLFQYFFLWRLLDKKCSSFFPHVLSNFRFNFLISFGIFQKYYLWVHSENWSVDSTLITAQKQCLGKCRFKCENDTFKCENDTLFILSSVGNDSLSVFLILLSVI
jgi:hypothetical protein